MGRSTVTLSLIFALAVASASSSTLDADSSFSFSKWLDAHTETQNPSDVVAAGRARGHPAVSSPALPLVATVTSILDPKYVQEIVAEHNKFRAVEHVGPMKWNATLEKYAHDYAEVRKGDCKLQHSNGEYGENIFFGTGTDWTWAFAVDDWASEKKYYDYATNGCAAGQMCGHYTQVVWRDTTDVGCGRVTCDDGDTFMVCSYYPPGNYDGEKPF